MRQFSNARAAEKLTEFGGSKILPHKHMFPTQQSKRQQRNIQDVIGSDLCHRRGRREGGMVRQML
eukprot:7104515-Pyramimonas_sp.AAC.1